MLTRCRLEPSLSSFRAQAFAGGLLSFLAHSPTFAARAISGTAEFEDDRIAALRMKLTAQAAALELIDRVRPGDRQEIESRMRREVLQVVSYPEITFEAAATSAEAVTQGRYRLRLAGGLALRGVEQPLQVDGELIMCSDGVRLQGETGLRMSEFGIAPVTALGGSIRLADELKLSFDLAFVPEGS
jgi:polyisoprenoid-binding protein YceI